MQTALTFVAILSIVMLFLCGTWPTFILLAVLTAISMVCCIVVSYILRKRTDEKDAKDAVLQNKITNWRKVRRRQLRSDANSDGMFDTGGIMLKSIAKTLSHDESALSGKKASKNLCVLPKSWFDLTEKQFKLYKILGEFLTSYNSPCFTATTGKNSDDVVMFYSLLFYFKKFDSYENYKRRNLPKHVKEFHAFSMLRLHDAFTRM